MDSQTLLNDCLRESLALLEPIKEVLPAWYASLESLAKGHTMATATLAA